MVFKMYGSVTGIGKLFITAGHTGSSGFCCGPQKIIIPWIISEDVGLFA
jgi:hypothetical protein